MVIELFYEEVDINAILKIIDVMMQNVEKKNSINSQSHKPNTGKYWSG